MNRQIITIELSEEMNNWFRTQYSVWKADAYSHSDIENAKHSIVNNESDLLIANAEQWDISLILKTVISIRQMSFIPILLLGDVDTLAPILENGGDCCLPFSISREALLAFAKALVRRCSLYDYEKKELFRNVPLRRGELEIDQTKYKVTLKGEEIRLQNREYALLLCFANNPGVVISAETICSVVWGTYSRDVTPVITSLRHKLQDDKNKPTYIETATKAGYRFLQYK